MTEVIVGIDPGKKGALAYFVNRTFKEVKDIPLIKTEVDVNLLVHLLGDYIFTSLISADVVKQTIKVSICLEDVHALYGSSAGATFSFGHTCGLIEGIASAYRYSMIKVSPKTWQKKVWIGIPMITKPGKKSVDSKAVSRLALNRLFPKEALEIPKSKDGQVDAILIGYWALNR